MTFGLEQHIIDTIISVFEANSKIDKAYVFGSRAKGNYRTNSDIDIAIKGFDIGFDDVLKISSAFAEKGMQKSFDLVDYSSIKEPALKDHIDRVGVEFYSRWKEYNLDKVYDFSSGLSKGAEEFGFGFEFLTFKDIFQNYFVPNELTSLVNSTEKERKSCSIQRGDVFLTRTSETDEDLGMSSVALKSFTNATFNGFTKRLRPNNKIEIHPEYAGFYFRTPKFRAKVSGMSSVTTRASLNNSMLAQLTIAIPPIVEQKAIAGTLIALHNKIYLLQRQNSTLEKLAETLYKEWFVVDGKDMSTVELGKIASIRTGKSLKREDFIDNGEFPILGANGEIGRTNKFLTDERIILTGRVGTLGKVYINEDNAWISDNVLIIRPNENLYFYPIYFSLLRLDFENLNVGSTQPLVTQSDLKKIELSLPCQLTLKEFSAQCSFYYEKITKNKNQIRTLTQTRDSLLPKMMSGEIRVLMN